MLISFLFCALLILLFSSIKPNHADINTAFLNKNYTTNVRGIAILFIMVSHCILFLYFYPPLMNHEILFYEKVLYWFIALFTNIGVGLFLFQSGYGNYFSIRKKSAKEWLIKKVAMLYTPVAILLIIPYILNFFSRAYASLFPHCYSVIQKLMLMTLSSGVYWYIKVQLIAYILLFICYKLSKRRGELLLTLTFVLYLILCMIYKIPGYWYITAFCFPFGVLCAKYSESIKQYLKTKIFLKIIMLFILIVPFCVCAYLLSWDIAMIFISLIASMLMVICSGILSLKSNFLNYLGEKSLILYLLHPEFVFIFRNFFVGKIDVAYCVLFTIIVSIILAYPLYRICNNINSGKLFHHVVQNGSCKGN